MSPLIIVVLVVATRGLCGSFTQPRSLLSISWVPESWGHHYSSRTLALPISLPRSREEGHIESFNYFFLLHQEIGYHYWQATVLPLFFRAHCWSRVIDEHNPSMTTIGQNLRRQTCDCTDHRTHHSTLACGPLVAHVRGTRGSF